MIVTIARQPGSLSRHIARLGWGLAVLAVTIQTAAQLTNQLMLSGRYGQLASANDGSVCGRANTTVIVSSALLIALSALQSGDRVLRRILLAALLGFLAVDDACGLHDRLLDLPARAEVAAAGLFAVVLALVLLLLWSETCLGGGSATLLRGGLVALAAAVATRVAGALVAHGSSINGTSRAFGVAVEQGLDFGGWILVAAGLAAGLWVARVDGQPSVA